MVILVIAIDLLCNFDPTIVIQKPGSLINKCGTATSENSSAPFRCDKHYTLFVISDINSEISDATQEEGEEG